MRIATGLQTEVIQDVLASDERVVFAYLYGSFTETEAYRDVDLAVYAAAGQDPFRLSPDLKIALHERTGIAPDVFDVRVINNLVAQGDLFALLYLQRVFEKNILLVDKDVDRRTDFLEQYSMKYRECEGLLDEVLL